VGFYIRKGFNFGPLRLNLSRSGLGASVGVKGARLGITARGDTYIHAGQGGLYYRQTLTHHSHQAIVPNYGPPLLAPAEQLQEITSASAERIVDSSATDLLQELNDVKRRTDLFPVVVIVGALLLVRTIQTQTDWWVWIAGALAVALFAIISRHSDVTNGTLLLRYSVGGAAAESFSRLQSAMSGLAACDKIWRVDAAGRTYDWKRNAGASVTERRHQTYVSFGLPPKVNCNISVPILKAGRKSLYFFPDRLLIYDSAGVGAIPYEGLQVQTGQTRFVESEYVRGATQVGTTWRFVNKNGGPDRRFNNNRQLPIMLYGEFSLRSQSGLNEWFQCSVPASSAEVSAVLGTLKPVSTPGGVDVSFTAPEKDQGWTRIGLWFAVALMVVTLLFSLPTSTNSPTPEERAVQAKLHIAQQNERKQQLAQDVSQRLRAQHNPNTTTTVVSDAFNLTIMREAARAAQRNGLKPLDKKVLFDRMFRPDTENEFCSLGFRTIRVKVNDSPPTEAKLDCPAGER